MQQATQSQPPDKIVSDPNVDAHVSTRSRRCRPNGSQSPQTGVAPSSEFISGMAAPHHHFCRTHEHVARTPQPGEPDPLYLFTCFIEWERHEEPRGAWELLSAAASWNDDTRAHARALLASSRHLSGMGLTAPSDFKCSRKRAATSENDMKGPYNLEIVDNCTECTHTSPKHFCSVSDPALRSLDAISHKSTLPAGAILFVEGQPPRGLFIVCSGRVNLSTTSREGKILILKSVDAGETLGLSATISGMPYEVTAETATPCQVGFVDRKHFTELMESHSEIGVHSAHTLSREYQTAYRDIHHLVLTRSSAGKLARLLLSQAPRQDSEDETRIQIPMTHEEMAQRIGASRETVTRLLSHLRKKRLIRLDGPTLVIRDRSGLEALTA
ncbi:MAG TPA: Crp/Fnr family transcriptional regulator [Candidatus Sulfotelmatobacter sp.]|nr:Crp/Fnr family transcriptional regulator [Candidatus Sulfotelmatobacter sp.]